jgi:hypothetical protein
MRIERVVEVEHPLGDVREIGLVGVRSILVMAAYGTASCLRKSSKKNRRPIFGGRRLAAMVERIMLFDLPNEDTLYDALIARSSDYEGLAYVCVKTTGIFCRLTCPARKPKRENTLFYDSHRHLHAVGFQAMPALQAAGAAGQGACYRRIAGRTRS